MKYIFLFILPALILAACQPKNEVMSEKAINPADLDTTVSPAVDFYAYANGGWMKKHPLPADKSGYLVMLNRKTNF